MVDLRELSPAYADLKKYKVEIEFFANHSFHIGELEAVSGELLAALLGVRSAFGIEGPQSASIVEVK